MKDMSDSLPCVVIPVTDSIEITYGRTIDAGAEPAQTSFEEVLDSGGSD